MAPSVSFAQPSNLLLFLSLFSPILVAFVITSMSFIFQNVKGLVYLGFLIAGALVRNSVYAALQRQPMGEETSDVCKVVQYASYGNATFSCFVFAFTLAYLATPMWSHGWQNTGMLLGLLIYACIDVSMKWHQGCRMLAGDIWINVLLGGALGSLFVALMQWGGSSDYLFFNEVSSTRETCMHPAEQSFRCSVYRDGKLISTL